MKNRQNTDLNNQNEFWGPLRNQKMAKNVFIHRNFHVKEYRDVTLNTKLGKKLRHRIFDTNLGFWVIFAPRLLVSFLRKLVKIDFE